MKIDKTVLLELYKPSIASVHYYLDKWDSLPDYKAQENALDRLFEDLCPSNTDIRDILIKCSTLNDFYSTNIFKIFNVAQHYFSKDIDRRLDAKDLQLVNELAKITIDGKERLFYSFATKYCSHHRPSVYPIYDSYVDRVLKFYRDEDHFEEYQDEDLKDYPKFCNIVHSFSSFYKLEQFDIKDIDKYLWQLGKDVFNPYDKESNLIKEHYKESVYNHASLICIKNRRIYVLAWLDKNNNAVPTGLPIYAEIIDGKVVEYYGKEAFELMKDISDD